MEENILTVKFDIHGATATALLLCYMSLAREHCRTKSNFQPFQSQRARAKPIPQLVVLHIRASSHSKSSQAKTVSLICVEKWRVDEHLAVTAGEVFDGHHLLGIISCQSTPTVGKSPYIHLDNSVLGGVKSNYFTALHS